MIWVSVIICKFVRSWVFPVLKRNNASPLLIATQAHAGSVPAVLEIPHARCDLGSGVIAFDCEPVCSDNEVARQLISPCELSHKCAQMTHHVWTMTRRATY